MDKMFGPEASEQASSAGVKGLVVMRRQLRLARLADQGRHIEPPGSNAVCFSFGPKTPLKRLPSAFSHAKDEDSWPPGFQTARLASLALESVHSRPPIG